MEKTWNDNKIAIIINFDDSEVVTLDLKDINTYKKCEGISTNGKEIIYKNNEIILEPYSIAILSNN